MKKLSNEGFSDENFKFGTGKKLKLKTKYMGSKVILCRRVWVGVIY